MEALKVILEVLKFSAIAGGSLCSATPNSVWSAQDNLF